MHASTKSGDKKKCIHADNLSLRLAFAGSEFRIKNYVKTQ